LARTWNENDRHSHGAHQVASDPNQLAAIDGNPLALSNYLLQAIASIIPPKGGAYVAGPLATGKRYYDLIARGQRDAAARLRDENANAIGRFAQELRDRLSYPVIDPSLIRVDSWSNEQTGHFYIEVLRQFVKEIWFVDGWEYSRGATKEFQFAAATGIRCLTKDGETLSPEQGLMQIVLAVRQLNQLGLDTTRFEDRIGKIEHRQYP
jgi:hypothetical protein